MVKNKKGYLLPFLSLRNFSNMSQRLLFFFAVFFSVSILSAYNLYVDASANPQGADGSVTHPYLSIQEAIDHALDDSLPINTTSPEVKIFISNNVYTESLNINFEDSNHENHFVQDLSLVGQGDGFELVPNSSTAIKLNGTTESKLKLQKTIINGISGVPERLHRTFLYIGSENMQTVDIHECVINGVSTVINIPSSNMDHLILNSCEINIDAIILADEVAPAYCESYLIYSEIDTFISDVSIINNTIIDTQTHIQANPDTYPYYLARMSLSGNEIEFKNNICEYIELNFRSDTNTNVSKFENNNFNNSRIYIRNSNSVITNNTFYCDPEYDPLYRKAISASSTWRDSINLSINRNTFWYCASVLELNSVSNSNPDMYNCYTSVYNNSFFECERVSKIEHNSSNRYTIHKYINNFFCGTSNTPFLITGYYYYADPIPISYSFFNEPLSPNPHLDIDESSMVYGEAHVLIDYDQISYELLWDYDIKSPLVNAGYPGPVSSSANASDPDGTRPDIGAVYYKHKHRDYFQSDNPLQQLIRWCSFPIIDDRSHTDGDYWNETGMFFDQYMQNAPDDHQLETVAWSYGGDAESMFYFNGWLHDNYEVIQPKGFKVKFRGDLQNAIPPLWVDGFDAYESGHTSISLAKFDSNGEAFPNWIGYFVPYTQSVEDAFSKAIPGDKEHTYLDYIYSISAQSWNTSRIDNKMGAEWIIPPHRLTLSEGDMVEVKLIRETPLELEEMTWFASGAVKDPYVRSHPEGFVFTELMDYTPIFIEFDPENTPEEVGIFVGDKCYGAAVVDDGIIEVNLYYQPEDEAKNPDDELSFMFYYADKSVKKAPTPLVYNPESLLFETGILKAGQIKNYGYVSYFKGEGSSMVPLLTQLNTNYPNPFREKTKITYILEKESNVTVDIYNIKGQKIKTLYTGFSKKGKHGLSWDATDNHGKKVASGVYFCRLSSPQNIQTQKMLLMK